MNIHEEVLIAIRQIIRATDLHSKKINKDFGLTSPQLLLMREIKSSENVTIRQLSSNTNMSQATATSILDRLEKRGLITRQRDQQDKRKVHALLTTEGNQLLLNAPTLLQDNFIDQFQALSSWEQTLILSSLQRISSMMKNPEIETSALLPILEANDPL
ncbi:MarR family winged helix-turn-helix transcriptional regulator [Vibrio aestuarianus]|mgnify:CR=1 FL=1|uniref:MarR family transcriptional regulator n=1 Tax=Vibrio aestuarianus TaxID=28171 RepID=A0AAX3U744_9VIBR|nr:MarR family transcriptional regulator [Vibrio aestuarianus]KOE81501.1 MarR family transcriptional regulator [Vibrio alginolyticus]MDE1214577.1 MarR family transcriptional regulator [Vibrio aestuarianus]MDE1218752.1 MarR family transcriptional regulator [Vibrio aestuarianus]MDE1221839.1 MarR family transcriptional regulator [Vibrio aestuarianus]MDE1229037.1 MarR family transcriptional regulator [Vibrio aestuarianus]